MHFKDLEKQEQIKPQTISRQELVRIRAEIKRIKQQLKIKDQ